MKKTAILLITIMLAAMAAYPGPVGSTLSVATRDFLDAFNNRHIFIQHRLQMIDSVSALPQTGANEYTLGALWLNAQVDSAISHMRRANGIAVSEGDKSLALASGAAICAMLPHIDAAGEALKHYQELDTTGTSREALLKYHIAGQELWFTLAHTSTLDTIRNIYLRNGVQHSAAICAATHPNNVDHNLAAAHAAYVNGHNATVVANLNELLDNAAASHRHKALANLLLARHYARPTVNDTTMANYYTLRSAAEYIRDGDMRPSITAKAARILMDSNPSRTARTAMRAALDNALASGSSISAAESAPYLYLLTDMHSRTITQQNTIIAVIGAAGLMLAVLSALLFMRMRRLRSAETRLSSLVAALRQNDIKTKETYITKFIQLCDSYMETTEEFLRSTRRKLSAGQISDLKIQLKGTQLLNNQLASFYRTFDSAFLHTFPDFVQEVNSLLQPDKQIDAPAPGTLTTELRIAAFARLGVDASSKVARFLGLSLATVYTYRNKLRAKALNRATFYDDLLSQTDKPTKHLQP